jgi:hypothetical protein
VWRMVYTGVNIWQMVFFLSWDLVETLGEAKVNQYPHWNLDLSE